MSILIQIETPRGAHLLRVHPGSTLAEGLRAGGTPLNTRCGGRGICDGCLVELIRGRLMRFGDGPLVQAGEHPLPVRACQHLPFEEGVIIRLPMRSLLAYQPQVVTDFRINVSRVSHPLWQRHRLQIPAGAPLCEIPRLAREQLDLQLPVEWEHAANDEPALPRIAGSPGAATIDIALQRRPDRWTISACAPTDPAQDFPPIRNPKSEIRNPRTQDSPGRAISARAPADAAPLGAAIDVGTTTVALLLVELASGKVVGRSAQFNRQMQLGDDVLTRIQLCITDPPCVAQLQSCIIADTIAPLLRQAMEQARADARQVQCIVLAGNTTMLHLLAGVNPAPMGTAPFTPVFLDHRVLSAGDLPGWPADLPACALHLLPGPAAYVGADLSAGMLASGLLYDDGPSLLVDVGTNGEIILKHGDHVSGCATAAGPAFEGAGLSSGVRAGDGAIGHLRLHAREVEIDTIGGSSQKPIGICGSGYIDFLAEARRAGLLNEVGRFDPPTPPAPPSDFAMSDRLIPVDGAGKGFVLAIGEGGKGGRPIIVTEADIARLLSAKAAVAAGVLTLLERRNLAPAEVKKVYLAGGFGTRMSAAHAIACGLLPGFAPSQIQPVGNSALAGAYLALLDSTALDEIAHACRGIEIVELNLDPGFESRYIEQLMLP